MKNVHVRNLLSLFLSLLFHFLIFAFLFSDVSIFPVQSAPQEQKILAEVMLIPAKRAEKQEEQKANIEDSLKKTEEIGAKIQVKEEIKANEPVLETVTPTTTESRNDTTRKRAVPVKKAEPKKSTVKNEENKALDKQEINTGKKREEISGSKEDSISAFTPVPSPNDNAAGLSQQRASSIVAVDSVIVVNRVKPIYPQISRKRGEEGNVILLANVVNGKVVNVTIEKSSGIKALDSSALTAVGKWSFSSGTNLTVRIPVSFKLKD